MGSGGRVIATPQRGVRDHNKRIQTQGIAPRAPGHPLSRFFLSLEQIWVENSDGTGAVNFLTGMGGFLQAVLFGYTGFR